MRLRANCGSQAAASSGALDPFNGWAATFILAAALEFARPNSFKPGGGD